MSTLKPERGTLRPALLAAGRDLLAEQGLEGLSLRAVTRRAGVSPTAAYRYFASRAELLAGIAAAGVWELTGAVSAADQTGADKLTAQAEAYVCFATANPSLYRLIFGAERPTQHHELESALEAAYGVLAARVAKIAPPGEAADRTLACWCLMHGLASLAIDGRLPAAAEPGAAEPGALAGRLARAINAAPG